MAAEEGIEVEERAFSVDEARRAREAFYTSASGFVMPAVSIDGAKIGDGRPGPIATKLRALYIDRARDEAI
jgi:D-alanine transaminase